MKTGSWGIVGRSLLIAWAIVSTFLYILLAGKSSYVYWSHLYVWQHFLERLGRISAGEYGLDLVLSFMGVSIFGLACISLGTFVAKSGIAGIKPDLQKFQSGFAAVGTSFLVGHGVISLVLFALGVLYKITPWIVALVIALGLLSGLRELKPFLKGSLRSAGAQLREMMGSGADRWIFSLALAILLISLLQSSARISYDASAIYFSDAKLTALTGHVNYFVDDTFVASVFQTAIQYSALILVFGDQAARMYSWVCGLIIIGFSLALGEKVGLSRRAQLMLLALICTSTAFLDLMGAGKVDLISTAPALAAVYWMVAERQPGTRSRGVLLLAGFLIGLASVSRPFNAYLLGVFTLLFYFSQILFRQEIRLPRLLDFLKTLAWIGLGASLPVSYHLLANWMILGSPLAFIATASALDPAAGPWYYDSIQVLIARLLYPFSATFRNTYVSLGNITPFFLLFLPAAVFKEVRTAVRYSKILWNVLVIGAVTLVSWITISFTVSELRYVIFLWILLYLPVSEIAARAVEMRYGYTGSFLGVVIMVTLAFIALRSIFISIDSYSPLDPDGNARCYDLDFCEINTMTNNLANPGDRILALHPFRYYLRSDLFVCSSTHDDYRVLKELSRINSTAFWEEVYRRGYTYVTYQKDYALLHLQLGFIPDPEDVPDWMALDVVYQNTQGLEALYRIRITNPPTSVAASCQRNQNGIWEVVSVE